MESEGRRRLRALKMTQVEMATKLGVSQSRVNDWLNGKYKPGRENREAIEVRLKIPVKTWDQEPVRATGRAA